MSNEIEKARELWKKEKHVKYPYSLVIESYEKAISEKDAEIKLLNEQVDILGKDNEDVYKYVEKNIDLKERHKKEKEKMLDGFEGAVKGLRLDTNGDIEKIHNNVVTHILELIKVIKNKYK